MHDAALVGVADRASQLLAKSSRFAARSGVPLSRDASEPASQNSSEKYGRPACVPKSKTWTMPACRNDAMA